MADTSPDELATPFHRGELEIQERLGVREKLHSAAPRFITDRLPDQHREFYGALPQDRSRSASPNRGSRPNGDPRKARSWSWPRPKG